MMDQELQNLLLVAGDRAEEVGEPEIARELRCMAEGWTSERGSNATVTHSVYMPSRSRIGPLFVEVPLVAEAPHLERLAHMAARLDEVMPTVLDCLRLKDLAREILGRIEEGRR